jgi:hypothetical protein
VGLALEEMGLNTKKSAFTAGQQSLRKTASNLASSCINAWLAANSS